MALYTSLSTAGPDPETPMQPAALRRNRNIALLFTAICLLAGGLEGLWHEAFVRNSVFALGIVEDAYTREHSRTRSRYSVGRRRATHHLRVGFEGTDGGWHSYVWSVGKQDYNRYLRGSRIPVWYVPGHEWNSAILEQEKPSYGMLWLAAAGIASAFAAWFAIELLTTRGRRWKRQALDESRYG